MNSMQEDHGGLAQPIRVIVADDNNFFRGVLNRFIEGWPELELLDSVADGCAALKSVGRLHPELVILDLHMAGLNGLEAAALIRESFPATRVVVISAEESEALRDTCLAQGADAFIPKRRLYQDFGAQLSHFFPNLTELQPA